MQGRLGADGLLDPQRRVHRDDQDDADDAGRGRVARLIKSVAKKALAFE
jgi:hypothetical protein